MDNETLRKLTQAFNTHDVRATDYTIRVKAAMSVAFTVPTEQDGRVKAIARRQRAETRELDPRTITDAGRFTRWEFTYPEES